MTRCCSLLSACAALVLTTISVGGAQAPVRASLPDFYTRVDHVRWVVGDLDAVLRGLKPLGLIVDVPPSTSTIARTSFRGRTQPLRVRVASGTLGGLRIEWVQPIDRTNAYREFLDTHGDGIISLVHRVPSSAALTAERQRLAALGVGVLQEEAATSDSDGETVYLDTERDGRYALGLTTAPPRPAAPASADFVHSQFAFAIREPAAISAFWQRVGLPAIEVTHRMYRERTYHGAPGVFDMKLGWQRHGAIPYEWCIPIQGPIVYQDHIDAHGEGLHHLGFRVPDMEATIASWTRSGAGVIQSGVPGDPGTPIVSRWAYMNTAPLGGVTFELLWRKAE
jgi:hypothetical protein